MGKYRILTIDGGGLRGLIAARMLQRLNVDTEIAGWVGLTELISGTSTGGILALAMAAGEQIERVCELYIDRGPSIFDDSLWDNIRDIGKLIGADYSNKALMYELGSIFRQKTLADFKYKVVIPTFDLDNGERPTFDKRTWKPKIFHNYAGESSDGYMLARTVALYTSAAPTYFPSVDGFIDGGVFANNPSMVALAKAISQSTYFIERADLKDVVLLSVGTGETPSYIEGDVLDWGYAQWAKPLLNILMDGVSGIADYQARQLLGERYYRLQATLDPSEVIPMDSVEKIPRMDEIGRTWDISFAKKWIKNYWMD